MPTPVANSNQPRTNALPPTAPLTAAAPASTPALAAPSPVDIHASDMITVSVGLGKSDSALSSLSPSQKAGNLAIHARLVKLGVLTEDYVTDPTKSQTWDAASTAALKSFESADGEKSDGWVKAPAPGVGGQRVAKATSTLARLDNAISMNKMVINGALVLRPLPPPVSAASTTSNTPPPAAPAGGTTTTTTTPPATPPQINFSDPAKDDPNQFDNWEGVHDMSYAIGTEKIDNRKAIASFDKQIADLTTQIAQAQNATPVDANKVKGLQAQVTDLQAKRAQAAADQGQPLPEGIMGGVAEWKKGNGWDGTGKIISGALQTPAAAVMFVSDGISRGGAFLRNWAQAKEAELVAENHGEVPGYEQLGLKIAEGAGEVFDFAFNVHDAKWYQWLLPTMWASGLLYLAGEVSVFLSRIIGDVFEALFDLVQSAVGWAKDKPSQPTDQQEIAQLNTEIAADKTEIDSVNALATKTAAMQTYLERLERLEDLREQVVELLQTNKRTDRQNSELKSYEQAMEFARQDADQARIAAGRTDPSSVAATAAPAGSTNSSNKNGTKASTTNTTKPPAPGAAGSVAAPKPTGAPTASTATGNRLPPPPPAAPVTH